MSSINWQTTSPELKKALLLTAEFQTAQFKKHLLKLYRDTYFMPLPSVIAGMTGAVMGIDKTQLTKFAHEKKLFAGADLIEYGGIGSETSRIRKLKAGGVLPPPRKSVFLVDAKYRLAISSPDANFLEELRRRVDDRDFYYDVYGGNDYNFLKDMRSEGLVDVSESNSGKGYCKLEDLDSFHPADSKRQGFIQIDFVNDKSITKYAFGIMSMLVTKQKTLVAGKGEEAIFLHPAEIFLRASGELSKVEGEQIGERSQGRRERALKADRRLHRRTYPPKNPRNRRAEKKETRKLAHRANEGDRQLRSGKGDTHLMHERCAYSKSPGP